MTRQGLLLGTCLVAVLIQPPLASATESEWLAQAIQAQREGLRKDLEKLTHVRCTMALKGNENTLLKYEFRKSRDLVALDYTTKIGDPRRKEKVLSLQAWGSTSKYTYHVGQNEGKWVIADLALEPNSPSVCFTKGVTLIEDAITTMLLHRYYFRLSLADVLEGQAGKVTVVKDRSNDRMLVVRIDVKEGISDERLQVQWVEFSLDGAHQWRLAETRQSIKERSTERGTKTTFIYDDRGELTEYHYYSTDPKSAKPDEYTKRAEHSIEFQQCGPLAESEFSLSHYGLPEPPGFEVKKTTPAYVWWLVAGTVVVAAGLLGRRILSRREPK